MKNSVRVCVRVVMPSAGLRAARELLRLLPRMTGIIAALAALPGLAFAQGGLRADFNADGFDDMAVPVPLEGLENAPRAGAVNVIYGTAGGLSATGDQIWHQNTPGIGDVAEPEEHFGSALATGDFNSDGFDDLAVGVPRETVGKPHAGQVHVIYGTAGGLSATGNQIWHQNTPGIASVAEQGDRFGGALATGDFNSDGFDDLAVGVPGEGVGAAGAVNIIYGTAAGLSATGNQIWHQDSPGINGTAENHDFFGDALATGDFDNDGFADLAVGVPWEQINGYDAGAVNVIYGALGGLSATGNQLWHLDIPGMEGAVSNSGNLGISVTTGDFDSDGYDDLAAGGYRIGVKDPLDESGAVSVIYGTAGGLSAAANQLWHQDIPGIVGAAGQEDYFGASVTGGDFDGDGYDDLAVGIPQKNYTGAVHVIYGAANGLASRGNQEWHQNSPGIEDVAEPFDALGAVVTAGNFNGDRFDDLAISVPGEDVVKPDAGQVHIIHGTARGLSATGSQIWHQNSVGIEDVPEAYDWFGGAGQVCPCPEVEDVGIEAIDVERPMRAAHDPSR